MNNYETINFKYYNPQNSLFKAEKNAREEVTIYHCCNKANCDAYKRGKCIMLNGLFGLDCPYGRIERKIGYTKNAKKCGDLISQTKAAYPGKNYALKELRFLCYIGDYAYLNLFHIKKMVKKDELTPEYIINNIIKYQPNKIYSGSTSNYQSKELPLFCLQLKKYMPEMYVKIAAICPEVENYAAAVNFVGKYAKVKTLLPGQIKLGTNILNWDGKKIHAKGKDLFLWHLCDEDVTIIPNDDTWAEIVNNATVNEDTEFRDE